MAVNTIRDETISKVGFVRDMDLLAITPGTRALGRNVELAKGRQGYATSHWCVVIEQPKHTPRCSATRYRYSPAPRR